MKYKLVTEVNYGMASEKECTTYTCIFRKHWWNCWYGVSNRGDDPFSLDVYPFVKFYKTKERAIIELKEAIRRNEIAKKYPKIITEKIEI